MAYKETFEQLANHLLNISPTIISANDLAKTFRIKSDHTVTNYISYLRQAFLLIGIKKYSTKSKIRITQEKVYPVDVAMMNRRENAFVGENLGWRLETVVAMHLLRKCKRNAWDLYYLNERGGECDFLLCNGKNVVQAVQVSYDISNYKTLKREINGLLLVNELTHCENLLLLTDHETKEINIGEVHISVKPVYDWTLEMP